MCRYTNSGVPSPGAIRHRNQAFEVQYTSFALFYSIFRLETIKRVVQNSTVLPKTVYDFFNHNYPTRARAMDGAICLHYYRADGSY